MMKAIFLILIGDFLFQGLKAQHLSDSSRQVLAKQEDSLKVLAYAIVNASQEGQRRKACNTFIPLLVHALKLRGSFDYPFDSLREISRLYPPDSSFRIFSWQMPLMLGANRYFGALQIHTRNGKLKLFPLLDNSEFTLDWTDTITGPSRWIGALYYNLVETHNRRKTYYTLFGYNANGPFSNKKILEALIFRHGRPVFGAPIFNFSGDQPAGPTRNRFVLEYKKDGNARLNFDRDLDMIIYDELVSVDHRPLKKFTYVPDGNYESFVWKNGQWMHEPSVLNQPKGPTPVPQPLKFRKDLYGQGSSH